MKYSTLLTSLASALSLSLCPLAAQGQETATLPEKIDTQIAESLTPTQRMSFIRKSLDSLHASSVSEDAECLDLLMQENNQLAEHFAHIVTVLDADMLRKIEQNAASGDANASTALGMISLFGWGGVEQDSERAVSLLFQAARDGEANALFIMGNLYVGIAEMKNRTEYGRLGMLMMEHAAYKGHAFAMYQLSICYLFGVSCEQDLEKAAAWYKKTMKSPNAEKALQAFSMLLSVLESAAEEGDAEAQFMMGVCHYFGLYGAEEDNDKALKWLNAAAAQDDASAQLMLGAIYDDGEIVPQDFKQAEAWYTKAAAQGVEEAKQALEELKSKKK